MAASSPPGQGYFDVALPLGFSGDVRASADEAVVHALGSPDLRLEVVAKAVTVTRTYSRVVTAYEPVTGTYLADYYLDDPPRSETTEYGAGTVTLTRVGEGAEILTHPGLASGYVVAVSRAASQATVTAAESETLRHVAPKAETNPDQSLNRFTIHYPVDYPHFNLSGADLEERVTGNFSILVWDVDLLVQPDSGSPATVETGRSAYDESMPVGERTIQNAVLTFVDAELVLTGSAETRVYAPALTVGVEGAAVLRDAVGGFRAGEDAYEATGTDIALKGTLAYALALLDGRTDRALVEVAGDLDSITLSPRAALDASAVFGAAAAKAAAVGGGALVLAAGAVLLVRRRDSLAAVFAARRVRPRSGPDASDPAEAAILALEAGDDERAAKLFERALDRQPDDVVLLVDYGTTLERLGRTTGARDALERAVRLAPARGEAHYYYSRVLAELGLTASALPHLQRALALDPRLREMARRDSAFRPLADHPSFLALVA